jgi:hypothetical protein
MYSQSEVLELARLMERHPEAFDEAQSDDLDFDDNKITYRGLAPKMREWDICIAALKAFGGKPE